MCCSRSGWRGARRPGGAEAGSGLRARAGRAGDHRSQDRRAPRPLAGRNQRTAASGQIAVHRNRNGGRFGANSAGPLACPSLATGARTSLGANEHKCLRYRCETETGSQRSGAHTGRGHRFPGCLDGGSCRWLNRKRASRASHGHPARVTAGRHARARKSEFLLRGSERAGWWFPGSTARLSSDLVSKRGQGLAGRVTAAGRKAACRLYRTGGEDRSGENGL